MFSWHLLSCNKSEAICVKQLVMYLNTWGNKLLLLLHIEFLLPNSSSISSSDSQLTGIEQSTSVRAGKKDEHHDIKTSHKEDFPRGIHNSWVRIKFQSHYQFHHHRASHRNQYPSLPRSLKTKASRWFPLKALRLEAIPWVGSTQVNHPDSQEE